MIRLQELRSHIGREVIKMYFSTAKWDAANTWEVDTPVKPPDVLFRIFLGNVTHDQILKGAGVGLQFNCFVHRMPLAV
ncbi:hypothetical protein CMV_002170 [Castanea mollissima]|uniref:Uncharacterized protein n=1 Tax=Castanea mollissima TaxID=60419 RepID=A0A8J4VXQ7_9ROSI|nr:hypothetical protein CMV_002170 [Castanea mollissima]